MEVYVSTRSKVCYVTIRYIQTIDMLISFPHIGSFNDYPSSRSNTTNIICEKITCPYDMHKLDVEVMKADTYAKK